MKDHGVEDRIFLAERWARRYPHLRARLLRAVDLASLKDGVLYIGEDTWQVRGSSGGVYYVGVDLRRRDSTCTCPDSRQGNHCKHRLAVALVWALGRRGQQA